MSENNKNIGLMDCDDAARAILGNDWRIPTKQEWEELFDNCTVAFAEVSNYSKSRDKEILAEYKSIIIEFKSKINKEIIDIDFAYESDDLANITGLTYLTSTVSPNKIENHYGAPFYLDLSSDANRHPQMTMVADHQRRYKGYQIRPVSNTIGVDLGLPSGTRWGEYNLREPGGVPYASYKQDCKHIEYKRVDLNLDFAWGDYFAWGETESKSEFSWSNYKYGNSVYNYTKYNGTDGLLTLKLADTGYGRKACGCDDAARAILGGDWRIPTKEECQELIDNVTYEFLVIDGNEGIKLTSKKNGKTLFLPSAGSIAHLGTQSYTKYENEMGESVLVKGCYWSSTLDISHDTPLTLYFDKREEQVSNKFKITYGTIAYGLPIRPVSKTKGIDLGLPSGLKWAETNLCGNGLCDNISDLGDYFRWGDTYANHSYHCADIKNYIYKDQSVILLGGTSSYSYPPLDFKYRSHEYTTLLTCDEPCESCGCDDAARAILGGDWRMPTRDEWQELIDNCDKTVEYNANKVQKGITLTSKINGKSIYIPRKKMNYTIGKTSYSYYSNYYWTSSCEITSPKHPLAKAYIVNLSNNSDISIYANDRNYYALIRPVSKSQGVDLGLPSGIKWGEYNLTGTGLTTKTDEFGQVFAWGEDEPMGEFKDFYNWDTTPPSTDPLVKNHYYKYGIYGTSPYQYTKYNIYDHLTTLTLGECPKVCDDAARTILGNDWRMPTREECEELLYSEKCEWSVETVNGVIGWRVTSKVTNKSIFIPGSSENKVDYWTSSYATYIRNQNGSGNSFFSDGISLYFGNITDENSTKAISEGNGTLRYGGEFFKIRPVSDNGKGVDLGLSVNWAFSNLTDNGLSCDESIMGDSYAWGETRSKTIFSYGNYKWAYYDNDFIKYNVYDRMPTLELCDVDIDSETLKSRIPTCEPVEDEPPIEEPEPEVIENCFTIDLDECYEYTQADYRWSNFNDLHPIYRIKLKLSPYCPVDTPNQTQAKDVDNCDNENGSNTTTIETCKNEGCPLTEIVLNAYKMGEYWVYGTTDPNISIESTEAVTTEYFNNLSGFAKQLLNKETIPPYTVSFKSPSGELSLHDPAPESVQSFTFPTIYGIEPSNKDFKYINVEDVGFSEYIGRLTELATLLDNTYCDNIWRKLTHEVVKNFDWSWKLDPENPDLGDYSIEGGERMHKIFHIMGRAFDDTKYLIDHIANTNKVTYDGITNTSNTKLNEINENLGWEVPAITDILTPDGATRETKEIALYRDWFKLDSDKNGIWKSLGYENRPKWFSTIDPSSVNLPYCEVEFKRRLAQSAKHIMRAKGTTHSIEMINAIFGIGDSDVVMTNEVKKLNALKVVTPEEIDIIKELLSNRLSSYDNGTDFPNIPLKHVSYKVNGEYVDYLLPFFDNKVQYDGDIMFQGDGGWAGIDGSNEYQETLCYLKSRNLFENLLELNPYDIQEHEIYYLGSLFGCPYNKVPYISPYFIIEDNKTSLPEFKENWRNIPLKVVDNEYESLTYDEFIAFVKEINIVQNGSLDTNDPDYIHISYDENADGYLKYLSDFRRIQYLSQVVATNSGNNPHTGYGNYDFGEKYFQYMKNPLKYFCDNSDVLDEDILEELKDIVGTFEIVDDEMDDLNSDDINGDGNVEIMINFK